MALPSHIAAWLPLEARRLRPAQPPMRGAFLHPASGRPFHLGVSGLAPRSEYNTRAGLFSHVHGGAMQRMTSMERAFHLARSGRFTTLTEVVTTLDREGYSANQIQGPLLK
jgi:hypothetical protein